MHTAPSPTPDQAAEQRRHFSFAVQLLGGIRNTARLLQCSERAVRDIATGNRPMHTGWMQDITSALRDHARICNLVAKRLDPLFSANLTEDQRTARPDARLRGQRRTPAPNLAQPLSEEEEEHLMAVMADQWAQAQEGQHGQA